MLPLLLTLLVLYGASGFHACPPADSACVAEVRSSAWRLWAEVDKALSQRIYELLTIYDWIPKEELHSRQKALQGLEAMEVAKQLLCAASFVRCDPEGVNHGVKLLQMDLSEREAAQRAEEACTADVSAVDWLGKCSFAIWDWADAEYFISAKDFMSNSDEPQTSEESDRLNLRKTDANAGYAAVVYPPSLSPGHICQTSLTPMSPSPGESKASQPIFGGEAFGDVAWVDVSNLRTRHLSSISLLEVLENGKAFQERHPFGLSRFAINLGGGDGGCRVGHGLDPVNCFFVQGFGGVVFEANQSLEEELQSSLGHFTPDVQIVMEAAQAETISQRLLIAMAQRPGRWVEKDEVDIIKVDVDGLDCHLVQALTLSGWRPKVWHVEINPLFPPNISLWPSGSSLGVETTIKRDLTSAFSRRNEREHTKQALVGCSLQALLDAAGSEYSLLHVEFENAVLVRKDISEALEPWLSSRSVVQKWRDGYFCHPIARVRLPHDHDEDSLFLHYDFRRWGVPS
ncbi:Uncharacterized protein SCF082_LOCUS45327 [Durusdinium trenchii]|uniref:Methyltransferase FkbM domain-containing protein n=1 Tax=Durusdinium trenchii TaxID=1381693 RepID=A0ABP0R7N7_9DINO